MKLFVWIPIILWLLVANNHSVAAAEKKLSIAVAANFKSTLEDLVNVFSSKTETEIRISSSSTGILYAQIISGAPFDIILAADVFRPKRLVENDHAIAETRFTYALGQLILWVPGHSAVSQNSLQETSGRISMANPATAPYGLAARQYLQSLDLWKPLESRLVFGTNVAQSFLHVVSGNAQIGLTALSLLQDYRQSETRKKMDYWMVPVHLYSQIKQQGVVLARSTNPTLAIEFLDFMKSSTGRSIISENGYLLPSRMDRP